jgi:hypothetical protein
MCLVNKLNRVNLKAHKIAQIQVKPELDLVSPPTYDTGGALLASLCRALESLNLTHQRGTI